MNMLELLNFKEMVAVITRKMRQANDQMPRIHSDVLVEIRDKNGKLKCRSFQHNLRTNAGADFWNTQLFTTSPGTKGAGFMALSTSTTPTSTDTTLPGEITTGSTLVRTAALSPTHTAATGQSQFTHTFTYDGTTPAPPVVVGMLGLFSDTHANGGTLALETALSPTATVNANGDTIAITWTINY
jgi:hypothetical protein